MTTSSQNASGYSGNRHAALCIGVSGGIGMAVGSAIGFAVGAAGAGTGLGAGVGAAVGLILARAGRESSESDIAEPSAASDEARDSGSRRL
jgi:hypothetical protein